MFLPIRVLIIEDNEDDMMLILRELRRGGFEPVYKHVETSEELLGALGSGDWDLVISDYSLPTFSAPDALKMMKKSGRDLPFIVVSGNVGEEIAVQLMRYGAGDYINKDNLTRLCPAILRELDEAKTRRLHAASESLSGRLWDILNNSLNEIYVFDSKTLLFKNANQAALKNLGYTLEELQQLHPYDIKTDFDKDNFSDKLQPLLSGETSNLQFQSSHLRKDKTQYPVETTVQLSTSKTEQVFFAIVLDITERVIANEEISSLARFPEENPAPIMRLNEKTEVVYANPASSAIRNYWQKIFSDASPDHWRQWVERCFENNEIVEFEEISDEKYYNWIISPTPDKKYVNCYGRDITRQKSAENDLKLAAQVFENTIEGIILTDADNRIIRVNPAFTQITGYGEKEVIGKDPLLLKSGKQDSAFFKHILKELQVRGIWQGELWNKRKNGEVYPEYLTVNAVKNEGQSIKNYISIFTDISERKEAEANIHQLAYYDNLTGLPNRFHIQEKLTIAIEQAQANGFPVAILHLDLRRFKKINEILGHKVADNMLELFSQRINQVLPSNTFFGRMEGDEFLLFANHTHIEDENSELIQTINKALETNFEITNQEIYLNCCIGVSHYPQDGDTVEALIKHAEAATAVAKKEEISLKIFSRELEVRGLKHISIENDLRKALEREEFILHYQPQIELETGKVVGVEALLRWNHPEHGLIAPLEFIPLLEETGLIIPVGDWIVREACMQNKRWSKLGIDTPRIAINLSAKQFNQQNLTRNINKIIKETNIKPNLIELEVTESTIMRQYDQVIKTLSELHESNIYLSIDDFGTGYSSLSYLKHFPIDVLKIDQSFVREIPENKDDTAIVNTIIAMGHNLNLKVIAEGVETLEQHDVLKEMGCELAQGYYFSRPLPPDECFSYLEKQSKL